MESKKKIDVKEAQRRKQQSNRDKQRTQGKQKSFRRGNASRANIQPKTAVTRNTLLGFVKNEAQDELTGVAQRVQTCFNPRAGVFRPLSDYSDATALMVVDTVFNVSTGTTNAGFSMVCSPSNADTLATASQSTTAVKAGLACWVQSSPTNVHLNPYALAVAGTAISGPLSTAYRNPSPATKYRVIGCEMIVTNTTPIQNQAGSGCICLYNGDPVAYDFANAQGFFEQQQHSYQFAGNERLAVHWFPGTFEQTYSTGRTNTFPSSLAKSIMMYYNGTASINETFRFDIRLVIEYVPTANYLGLVDVEMTSEHSNVYHNFMNMITSKQLPVCTNYESWLAAISKFPVLSDGHTLSISALGGSGGQDAKSLAQVAQEEEHQMEEVKMDLGNQPHSKSPLKTAIQTALNVGGTAAGLAGQPLVSAALNFGASMFEDADPQGSPNTLQRRKEFRDKYSGLSQQELEELRESFYKGQ